MIPDRSQYFFDDSGNFRKFRFFGPVVDHWTPYFSWIYFKKYKKNTGTSLENMDFGYLNFLEFQIFAIFWTSYPPHIFCIIFEELPEKIASSKRILGVFPLNNSKSSIILTKWKIISKSQWNQKYFSKSHLWFVWTRNVVESWYFWQIRLWNSHGLLVFMENHFFEL